MPPSNRDEADEALSLLTPLQKEVAVRLVKLGTDKRVVKSLAPGTPTGDLFWQDGHILFDFHGSITLCPDVGHVAQILKDL